MKLKKSCFSTNSLFHRSVNKFLIWNSSVDFTYLFEKLKIKNFVKLTFKKFTSIKIQETLFYKYVMFINKQSLYNKILTKYSPLFNLHNYISNFPIFIYNISTTHKILLFELKTQIQYLKNSRTNNYNLKVSKKTTLNSLKAIESIFELYMPKTTATLISPTNSFILNFNLQQKYLYYTEIPIQNLIHNLNITIISTRSKNYLVCLKTVNSLIIGGDILSLDTFSPNSITLYYYNTLAQTTNLYAALKNTSIYTYNLILESLLKQYRSQGILLPSFLFELIVKRMVSYVRILKSGDTLLAQNNIVPGTLINLVNKSFTLNGLIGSFYIPVIMGISKLSLSCSGLLSSLSFQETLKSLSKAILDNRIDWVVDLKAKIIMSDLLDTGTGWYKHYNIKIQ